MRTTQQRNNIKVSTESTTQDDHTFAQSHLTIDFAGKEAGKKRKRKQAVDSSEDFRS